MSNESKQAAFEKLAGYVSNYMVVLDGFDNGLMKVHEALGAIEERITDVFDAARNGVWALSEMLDEHREGVWQQMADTEKKVYPEQDVEAQDGCPSEDVKVKAVKSTADMSRQEKINFLIAEYGLSDTPEQRHVLERSSDLSLTDAVNILKVRKNQ